MASAARLNRHLDAGRRRADDLEGHLAAAVQPILERAAHEAASAFQALATDHMAASAALRAADRDRIAQLGAPRARALLASLALTSAGPLAGVTSTSTMICVKPRPDEAAAIADPDGTAPEDLHVTLAYLGDVEGDLTPIVEAVAAVAARHAPLAGVIGGYGQFQPPGVGILLPDVPGLVELRVAVTEALVAADIGYGRDHGFQPHLTVDGDPEPGEQAEMLERAAGMPLHFDDLYVVRGDVEMVPLPLVGVPALTAAARQPFCLPSQLRTKTDPVRLEVVKTMAKSTIEGVGISFDVTNPFVSKALGRTASQVGHISKTTQADLMRTIRASYDQGLSIPDTAKAIREAMLAAAPERAVMIARTELAAAVNGGSLVAVQVVQATGAGTYYKEWLTAPGAKYPRHEDYDGLDGQTTTLDGYFDVGGSNLQHPADPDGDPGEIINCRCTMSYTEDTDALTSSAARRGPFRHHCHDENAPALVAAAIEELEYLTASAGPAGWSAPAADEMLRVDCAPVQAPTAKALDPAASRIAPARDSAMTSHNLGGGNLATPREVAPGARRMYVDPDDPPTLYRTEHAHAAYKGKAVWGDGRYYGTDLESTANLQLDPDEAMPEDVGDPSKVDSYALPPNARILDIYPDQWNSDELDANSGNALRTRALDGGYDGVHVITESANYGGDQVVLYRPIEDIQKRYDVAISARRNALKK